MEESYAALEDLYDDILGGTLSPSRVACVEALLEVGVHRRVLRLPEGGPPLQVVREAAGRLLASDTGLRDAVGSARLVFQRRSLKFDTWVDMEKAGERPVTDGERLRVLPVSTMEAGEILTSEGEGGQRRRRGSDKRRHKRRRHRSGSSDGERRRRHRRRRRRRSASRSSSSADSEDGQQEGRKRKRRGRKERTRRYHRRHRRHSRSRSRTRSRSRSTSRDSDSSRSGSIRRRLSASSGASSQSDDERRSGSARRWRTSPAASAKRRVAPPRQVSSQAWQRMDPEFAEQLRLYELERAKREGRGEPRDHLADLADISDGDLSPSDSESPAGRQGSGQAESRMTELGRRVLDRLKKLRQQFGGGDGAPSSTDDAKMKTGDEPEAQGMWGKSAPARNIYFHVVGYLNVYLSEALLVI